MKRFSFMLLGACLLLAGACTSSSGRPAGQPAAAAPTPAPLGRFARTNPNIIEETDTYFIERLPKSDYIRQDDRHIRHPILGPAVEFFKEDADYYYVFTYKPISEEEQALRKEAEEREKAKISPTPAPSTTGESPVSPVSRAVTLADFTDIIPPRVSGRIRLEEMREPGLPKKGMWRASFAVADMNGDGILDIIAPPARIGGTDLQIWLGDGKGKFTPWPLTFTEGGRPVRSYGVNYGGVAVGDIDGDGHMDMVFASHGGGIVSFFGDGKGGFEVSHRGLPGKEFSAQAIALVDVNGDGKLAIVASTDAVDQDTGDVDKAQLRVYLYRSGRSWYGLRGGIVGGFYSYWLTAWDFDGDGKKDILTGAHYPGALTILWKNQGNGTFSPVSFPEIEIYGFHFATPPGTYGKQRAPAFADAYASFLATEPEPVQAAGITVYSYERGSWTRHRVWRKKNGNPYLYALAMGDLDGDGLDDIVFPDSESNRLRVFFQEADGSFREMAEAEEPQLDSPGQCVRLADVDGDGRLDIILSKTVSANRPNDPGGWNVYLNRR